LESLWGMRPDGSTQRSGWRRWALRTADVPLLRAAHPCCLANWLRTPQPAVGRCGPRASFWRAAERRHASPPAWPRWRPPPRVSPSSRCSCRASTRL
jgi:hypothetical protein